MDGGSQNEQLWRYYQNERAEVFELARPRLNFLIKRIDHILGRARSTAKILNIGVGNGYLERTLIRSGYSIAALDPDASAVGRLSESGVEGIVASLPSTRIAGSTFDLIVASEVLEHLGTDILAPSVREIARLLRPNGWFIGTVPYAERLTDSIIRCPHCDAVFHRWGHQQSFHVADLNSMLTGPFYVRRAEVRAFVDFKGRSLPRMIAGAARYVLGRWGYSLAVPCIYFETNRSDES